MGWDRERTELLNKLWSEGLSASEIANRMGNTTRNAVISKCHRMGLTGHSRKRLKPKAPAGAFGRKTPSHAEGIPKPPRLKAEPVPPPRDDDIPTKTFDDLEFNDGCCRWPIEKQIKGHKSGFCGKKVILGFSWCSQHAPRVYANWIEIAPKEAVEAKTEMETA